MRAPAPLSLGTAIRRALFAAAVVTASAGILSVAIAPEGDDALSLATGEGAGGTGAEIDGRSPGTAPSTTDAPRADEALPTTTTTSPNRMVAPATGSAQRSPAPTPTTAPKAPSGPTTSTTIDWRAAGLPGPVGSTVQPWTQAPYSVGAQGGYSAVQLTAPRDGGRPGENMRLTMDASWTQLASGGSVVLVGPLDYSKSADQQAAQVLTTWSKPCDQVGLFGASENRTVTKDLVLKQLVKPEYTMDDLRYELWTTRSSCSDDSAQDAYVQFSIHVAEPFVVHPPGSLGGGLAHTG